MEIDIKNLFKSSLDLYSYCILQLIFEKKYKELDLLISRQEFSNEDVNLEHCHGLKNLINWDYLRSNGDTIEEYFLAPQGKYVFANVLTKEKEIDKNITLLLYHFFMTMRGLSEKKAAISVKSPSNRKLVKDRLTQGYTVDEIKAVFKLKHPTRDKWSRNNPQFYSIGTLLHEGKFQSYMQALAVFVPTEKEKEDTWGKTQLVQ